MKVEQFESHVYHEGDEEAGAERRKLSEKELMESIEKIMASHEYKIGEGRTAEVYYPEHNDEVCFKLIEDAEAFGKEIPPQYKGIKKRERPAYNRLIQEGEFLAALENIHPEVDVPTPHIALTMERSEEGDKYWLTEKIQALLMKRLKDSATLREIIKNDLPLPKDFDVGKFFKLIREFTDRMHEKKIYHRDLHDGNMMLDLTTGRPSVIDFGASVFANEEDAYHDQENPETQTVFIKDEENIDRAERLFRRHLTKIS